MDKTHTILAVDDQKENLDVILDILDEYDVIPATNGEKAIQIANNEDISLILLDIVMPDFDGYEVCKILKSQSKTKDIPIIFTTAKTDEESIANAYNAGASDYVSKPLKRLEVIARVNTQLKLKKTIEDLEYIASRDVLTGVYNRRKFFELSRELFTQYSRNIFVCMIDIDFFKKINDTYGHDMGDIVIKVVSNTISKNLPKGSIFARIGGEEFVAVCISDNVDSVKDVFENIKNTIQAKVIEYNQYQVSCTISMGLTQINDKNTTMDTMLKEADLALYEAKNSGRNKLVYRA